MNYSQKKSVKFFSKMFSGVLPALFVVVVAVWFSGGTRTAPKVMAKETPSVEVIEEEVGFLNPTEGILTSAFGERWGRKHKGIDIGADTDTMIYAADSGIVTYAGEMNGYGNYIVIDHQNGYETAYAHCNAILVNQNQYVKKGEPIARVGSTGNSTGPHLHFEVRKNNKRLDSEKNGGLGVFYITKT